jgi:hypothetical protein
MYIEYHEYLYGLLHMVYGIKGIRLSVTCGRSVVFPRYVGFLHQYNWPHNMTEILLTVALKHTITLTQTH